MVGVAAVVAGRETSANLGADANTASQAATPSPPTPRSTRKVAAAVILAVAAVGGRSTTSPAPTR